jgi:hypothetical protein
VLDRFNERLWRLTRHLLAEHARFEDEGHSFFLVSNPFPGETIHPGPYRMGRHVEDANTYRVGHPLAQRVLARGRDLAVVPRELHFAYRASGRKISVLEGLVGRSGWLACAALTVSALEDEDHLLLAGVTDAGHELDEAQCRRLFDLGGREGRPVDASSEIDATLTRGLAVRREAILADLGARSGRWFDAEIEKLDAWAEDRQASLRAALDEIDAALKDAKKAARTAPTLPEKLERQREVRTLDAKRDEAWRSYDQAAREIDRQKDALLDEISRRLAQQTSETPLFTIRWSLK